MVQFLLRSRSVSWRFSLIFALMLSLGPVCFAASKDSKPQPVSVPELELEGGRLLTFERTFWSEPDVRLKRGFWNKLVDVVAGAPDYHSLVLPYSIATDSRGRIIVSDPGAPQRAMRDSVNLVARSHRHR